MRQTFAGNKPPRWVNDKKNWHMVKADLNNVAEGLESPNSSYGLNFLATNRKAGGVSWDFGLGTCMPPNPVRSVTPRG